MKKIQIALSLLMLFSAVTLFAQDNGPETRRTAAEQETFEKSVPVNPAKINPTPETDAQRNPIPAGQVVPNWKPVTDESTMIREDRTSPVTEVPSPLSPVASQPDQQPPAANPAGKTTNHRQSQGTLTQPEPQKAEGKTVNYRNQKPVENQPSGGNPDGK